MLSQSDSVPNIQIGEEMSRNVNYKTPNVY